MNDYVRHVVAALATAVIFGAGWTTNGWRLGRTIADMRQQQAERVAETHRLESMWSAHVIKIGEDANAENERLRLAAARAESAGRSLLDAAGRHAAAATFAPGTSEAAARAIALHAELRRRVDEVAGELAAYADAARAAGLACERTDAVTR